MNCGNGRKEVLSGNPVLIFEETRMRFWGEIGRLVVHKSLSTYNNSMPGGIL